MNRVIRELPPGTPTSQGAYSFGRRILLMFSLVLVAAMSGCMTFQLEGDGEKTTESVTETATLHGSLYKFTWSDWQVEACGDGRALYRVEYHTNALYLLASVVSLGLYVPQTVTWHCDDAAQAGDDDGDEEEYIPGGAN